MLGVDRSIVCFIIDEQHGRINRTTPLLALCSFSHSSKFFSVFACFLMTKTAGSLRFWRGIPTPLAMTLLKSRIEFVKVDGQRLLSYLPTTDYSLCTRCKHPGAVPPHKPFINPDLSLVTQIVVNTCNHDNQAVTCICCL